MLKRPTQIISLLIAATSIMSTIPVTAVEYQKVEAKEGIIYDASSKGGGVFIIDGEINGDEDEAIYILKDGKYTKLEDAVPGDTIGDICQDKYLEMTKSNGDVYYVDITTGKESDDYDREVENNEVARKVRNKIKKDDDGRFLESTYKDNIITADTTVRGDGSGQETMWGITGKWRQYFYNLDEPFTADGYSKDTDTVYSDDQGNYMDIDYNLGKISVYTTTGAGVTIDNTKDTYEIKEDNKTYQLKAQIKNLREWDEGIDKIVRSAALTIWKKEKGSDDSTYVNVTDQMEYGSKSNHHKQAVNDDNSVTVLQSLSKAVSSDSVDGIKYPKTVNTYFLTDKDGNAQPLLGLGNGYDDIYTRLGLRVITGGTQGGYVSVLYDFVNKKIYGEAIDFKSKGGYNYIDIDSYDEADCDSFKLGCGDLWTLGNGYVQRFNVKENKFEKLYRVDSGMTNLHCSLPTDVVVWNKNKEIYSIVYPKASAQEQKDSENVINMDATTSAAATTTAAGWLKNNDGTWNYIKGDKTKAVGWINDSGVWYYLKDNGLMATGWVNSNGDWYYLGENGDMKTGWIKDNGTWYYCNSSGEMLSNVIIDGYVLGSNGTWIQ